MILARQVPPAAIASLVPVVDRARRQEAQLRGLFGWGAEAGPVSTEPA